MHRPLPTEVIQAFPNIQQNKFISVNGGRKFQGPCPYCGGDDRFIVWQYHSHWWARCTVGEHFTSTHGQIKASTMIGQSVFTAKMTEAEQKQAQEAYEAELRKEALERDKRIADLNKKTIQGLPPWIWYHQQLMKFESGLLDMKTDGISKKAIWKFMVGYNPGYKLYDNDGSGHYKLYPAYTFPTFSRVNGKVICTNIRHRLINAPEEVKRYRPYMVGLGIDCFKCIIPGKGVVITEGEKKAMVLWEYGFSAIGLWGVNVWHESWITAFRRMKTVCIVFDFEENENTRMKVINAAHKLRVAIGPSARVVYLPEPGKVDDLLVSGKLSAEELRRLMNEAFLP